MDNSILISTVTPVYNGALYLPKLVEELRQLKEDLASKTDNVMLSESIFVVDNAVDNSFEVLDHLSTKYSWVKVLSLSKNFGQHPATIAGILHTSGDWVITLDEDMQHRPHLIPHILKKLTETHTDICYAAPIEKVHSSIIKDFLASSFKRIISVVLSNKSIKHFNSFRGIRGNVARASAAICRHETYYDVAIGWFSDKVSVQPLVLLDERNQSKDESGYSFWGLIKHAKRMIMSSKIKLFRLGIPLGIFAFFFSILISCYAILSRLFEWESVVIKGWFSLILVILFFGGLTTMLTAFILESLFDLSLSINGKPTYFIVDRKRDKDLLKQMDNYLDDAHL